jgi:hypothetical protein
VIEKLRKGMTPNNSRNPAKFKLQRSFDNGCLRFLLDLLTDPQSDRIEMEIRPEGFSTN